METALSSLFGWTAESGLGVNPEKTILVLFNWKDNFTDRTRNAAITLISCKKKTIGRKWGFFPIIVHWLYTAYSGPFYSTETLSGGLP